MKTNEIQTIQQQLLTLIASMFDAYTVTLFLPTSFPNTSTEEVPLALAAYYSNGDNVNAQTTLAPGQGLVGWIVRNTKSLIVHKFDQQHSHLNYYINDEEGQISSFMGAPLPLGGALCVDTKREYPFSDLEYKHLQMAALILDSILHTVEESLDERIDTYFKELALINSLRTSCRQWHEYINSFLKHLADAAAFDYCAFASVAVPSESYCIEAESQPLLVQRNVPFYQSMGNGIAGWVFRNGQSVFQSGEDGRAPALFGNSENLPEFVSVVCIPVMVNKGTRGCICLGHMDVHVITPDLRTFLLEAVSILSLYLENLYLRNRLRDTMTQAPIYRSGPRMHDPDTSPYNPTMPEHEE